MSPNQRYIANKRTGGKRTKEQREADKTFCADLFVKGYTYKQISEKLNEWTKERGLNYEISYRQIYVDINQVMIEWKKEQIDNIDKYISLELKKLDKIEVELWEAWEKSKKPKRKTKIDGGNIQNDIVTGGVLDSRQLEDRNGEPRYLELLLKVQERRAKLLGYNAPVKVDVCSSPPKEEAPVQNYNLEALPTNMLVSMAQMLQDAEFAKRKKENE